MYSYIKSYRRRLTPPAHLLPRILLKNQNLEIELINISEDDFYPNRFWAQLETDIIKGVEQEIEPYDDVSFELLNPSRVRYYFILDSPPIDIGEYLIGDIIQIHIAPYVATSKRTFVRWFKEPLKLSQFWENITVLAEGTEGILINGLRDEEFGHIRAVVYDFTNEIPGSVAVAQRLFDIRKDITKTCTGRIRSTHSCKCNAGFEGNGVHCIDMDECKQGMPFYCLPRAACVNTHGSYKCQCFEGYDGDGVYSCIDVDECVLQQDICNHGALCVNTLGSFICVCQSGYFGDGNQCIATSIWSPWSPWSLCTATCGMQNKMRIRVCTHPESGMRCEGPSAELTPCEERNPCPVDGEWSEWSPWSTCTTSCLGIKTRVRICDNPAPAYGGLQCSGSTEQGTACGNSDCPVIGIWSPWAPWTICSVSCGMSMVRRSRVCNELFPGNGMADCVGSNQEERSCGFPVDYCKYLSQPPSSIRTGRWI
ncbi:SCO-spondin-like [Carcharodon carcharias]|uniref:SCO-spondin-like n=1 Tax=Carcharodon carcharias TaxID=13397 RepID=UPI001B7E8A22|nr:SCO-spondin-like [Carcharodon carcharias]